MAAPIEISSPLVHRERDLPVLRRDTLVCVVAGFALTLALACLAAQGFDLAPVVVARAAALYGLIASCVLVFIPAHLPHRRFGLANIATLVRAVLISVLAGYLGAVTAASAALSWMIVAVSLACIALDGVDGWLARRAGSSSQFGGRFDRELDGLLVLVLSLLLWQMDKAGAWVLLIGAMHYGFLAMSLALPGGVRDLPESRFRQWVGVLQTVVLLVCLSPLMTSPWSERLLALGLIVLLGSFGRDFLRLRGPGLRRSH